MSPTLVAVTSVRGVAHLVPDGVIAACCTGRYMATCGASFIPAAMTQPDGARDCPLCVAVDRTAREGPR